MVLHIWISPRPTINRWIIQLQLYIVVHIARNCIFIDLIMICVVMICSGISTFFSLRWKMRSKNLANSTARDMMVAYPTEGVVYVCCCWPLDRTFQDVLSSKKSTLHHSPMSCNASSLCGPHAVHSFLSWSGKLWQHTPDAVNTLVYKWSTQNALTWTSYVTPRVCSVTSRNFWSCIVTRLYA